jgi:hypothetical protein
MDLTPRIERFEHPAFPTAQVVYPVAHEGLLNYGLDLRHLHARHDGYGLERPDPNAGFFPTSESVLARQTGATKPLDALFNVRGGLVVEGQTNLAHTSDRYPATLSQAIELAPGGLIMRFGSSDGAWWFDQAAAFHMLERKAGDGRTVGGVQSAHHGMDILSYVRKYLAIFHTWSELKEVVVARPIGRIRCFKGIGAAQGAASLRPDSHGRERDLAGGAIPAYTDVNEQLYIPNLRDHTTAVRSEARDASIRWRDGKAPASKFLHIIGVVRPAEVDRAVQQVVVGLSREGGELTERERNWRVLKTVFREMARVKEG